MNEINSLPVDVLNTVFSLVPRQTTSLSLVCKWWHRVCCITYFSAIPNKDSGTPDARVLSAYISKICSPLTFGVLTENLEKTKKYQIHLRVDHLKEQLPLLATFSKTNFDVIGVTITHAQSQDEITEIFSLFKNIESVYFTDCTNLLFPLSSLQYPPCIKKIFFKNVQSPEEIKKTFQPLTACPHLRKLFIQSPAHALLPKKELIEHENSHGWEVIILDEEKAHINKISTGTELFEFWKNPAVSLKVKFNLLFAPPTIFEPLLYIKKPNLLQTLEGEIRQDLEKRVAENPKHVLALNCLAALTFFLSPEANTASANDLLNQALAIEPDNVVSNALLLCLYDQKGKTDESAKKKAHALLTKTLPRLTETLPLLIDQLATHIIFAWLTRLLAQTSTASKDTVLAWLKGEHPHPQEIFGIFAETPEGTYWLNMYKGPQEHTITSVFQNLLLRANDKKYAEKNGGANVKEKREAYDQLLQFFCTHYPCFAPFLQLWQKDDGGTEWEKAFHPEELMALQPYLMMLQRY
jgi:hypothetical protein